MTWQREYHTRFRILLGDKRPGRLSVVVNDAGITGPCGWLRRNRETLAWHEIQDVKLNQWTGYSLDSPWTRHEVLVIPKEGAGKRHLVLDEWLEDIGELITFIKEKSGLLAPIQDVAAFLRESRVYPYDQVRSWGTAILLGSFAAALIGVSMAIWYGYGWSFPRFSMDPARWAPVAIVALLVCVAISWAWACCVNAPLSLFGVKRVVVNEQGVLQYQGKRMAARIGWEELQRVEQPLLSTTLISKDGRRLTITHRVKQFDELNQIIRLQKQRLEL